MNQDYEKIKLPESLSDTVHDACARAAREKRRRRNVKILGTVAAACAAVVLMANVPPVATALRDVPIVGSLVRVLQFGGGGERTDGSVVIGGGDVDGSVLRLSFQTSAGASETTPAYEVHRYEAPSRLTITLNGVRGFDLDEFEQSVQALPLIRAYYREMLLDDSAIRFTLELAPGVNCEVSEYQQPGYLDLRLFEDPSAPPPHTVYFLRANAAPQSESLALLAEMYADERASIVQTQEPGVFTVVMGTFRTQEDAEAFYTQIGSPAEFWVDHCESDENPL